MDVFSASATLHDRVSTTAVRPNPLRYDSGAMKKRPKKQSDPIAITAPIVTDATAPALLGMSPRQFRDAVRRQRVPHMKLGRSTVVFFADLQRLAHTNTPPSEAHAEPRDRHNRRLAAATDQADFEASLENLDMRDRINAVLGRIGYRMKDEAYEAYGPGQESGKTNSDRKVPS